MMVQQSCRTCEYDTEMNGQRLCILRRSLVMEFAKDHLGFPGNFEIQDNWFVGHETCDYWVTKQSKQSFRSAVVRAMREAHLRNPMLKII